MNCLARVRRACHIAAGVSNTLHVLLADGASLDREVARRLLEKRGHTVSETRSGEGALDLFRAQRFDLVVMAVELRGMDGLEATRRIRREGPAGRVVPILGMTSGELSGDRERCAAAGMNARVAKPLRARSLLAAIDDLRAETSETG